MTVGTWLPVFPGFYETGFDGSDSYVEYELELSDDELKEHYPEPFKAGVTIEFFRENFWYYCDFKKSEQDYAECLAYSVERLDHAGTITDITFEKVVSPKYYNFSNDSINVEITVNKTKIKKYLKNNLQKFTDYITEKYTSRDGFSCWYPSDVDEWLDVDNYGSHELGSVLNFIIFNEDKDAVYSLMDEANWSDSYYSYTEFDHAGMIKKFKEKQAA